MVLVDLARFHVSVQPAVDGLEGDPELLGELGLAEPVFEAVDTELVDEVLGHRVQVITSYNVCQRESLPRLLKAALMATRER